MESSQTGNGPEENDKTGGCRHGEQVATINHDMPLFAGEMKFIFWHPHLLEVRLYYAQLVLTTETKAYAAS